MTEILNVVEAASALGPALPKEDIRGELTLKEMKQVDEALHSHIYKPPSVLYY